MIRRYEDRDAAYLAPIHTAVFPDEPLSPAEFRDYVAMMRSFGGGAWIIGEGSPFGYAITVPVPGLPHIVELRGCIAPDRRRRDFGSRLLQRLLRDLQGAAVRQVTHHVPDLDSAAAQFLLHNDFYAEHEEVFMRADDLRHLPRPAGIEGVSVVTLPRSQAIETFLHLYSASFSGSPWDQPYSRHEVVGSLDKPADILFLALDSRPIAFCWLHEQENGLAVIEPLGVLPEFQKQGYGRFLLLSALHELVRRGAARAQIGAWTTNRPAIHLYESLGFTVRKSLTFLAFDLPNENLSRNAGTTLPFNK